MSNASGVELPSEPHPLLPGASPATIRSFLLPGDRPRFLTEYEQALEEARRTLELAPVVDVVEQWRRIAVLQSDPERFRRTVRRAAECFTGRPSPPDEPFDQTRTKARM